MALSAEAIVALVALAAALPPAVVALRALYTEVRLGEFCLALVTLDSKVGP
jgi:hypothetical protein